MCASVLFKKEEAISQSKILVVDDNAEIRKLLVLHLKASGYDIVEPATGLEAIKKARATSPDLIIMDLAMPDGNGDEVTASLKADPLMRDIPVIVLTAFLHGPLVSRAIAAGAAEILYKPINLDSFDLALRRHLSAQAPRT